MYSWPNEVGVVCLCCPGVAWKLIQGTSSRADHQSTVVHSRLSSLSRRRLTLGLKSGTGTRERGTIHRTFRCNLLKRLMPPSPSKTTNPSSVSQNGAFSHLQKLLRNTSRKVANGRKYYRCVFRIFSLWPRAVGLVLEVQRRTLMVKSQ